MLFSQVAVLLVVASVFGVLAKIFRQPLLVGYLFAGLVLAAVGLVDGFGPLADLGKVGVALLLFLLGLEMNLKEITTIGKHASVAGFFEMLLTALVGFGLAILLGFSTVPALYISIALTFSSTIIMVKLLSEKKDLASLYGKISVGSLLFQDIVAIVILIFLAGVGAGGSSPAHYLFIVGKLGLLLLTLWFLSKKVIPAFFEKFVSGSPELVFIASVAWALGVASFVAGPIGFSLEIGGFLAGLALSNIPEHLQIASRSRALRDFFLTLFFIYLGTQLVIEGSLLAVILPAVLFSIVVLIVNPISVLVVMGLMGYKRRTSFLSALTVSQTSEFSLILLTVGATLGHVGQKEVAVVILVTAITMTTSTYLILSGDRLFTLLRPYLAIFERKQTKEELYKTPTNLSGHIVLVGCDRTGRSLVKYFARKSSAFLVVDFNLTVFNQLTAQNVPVIFGDISDTEVFDAANIHGAKCVISTISDLKDNLALLENISHLRTKPVTIFTAATREDGLRLYEAGATYLIVPEVVAGEHIRQLLKNYGLSHKRIKKLGASHFNRLIYT